MNLLYIIRTILHGRYYKLLDKHSSGGVVVVVPCCATLCTGYDCTVVYYYHLYCCKLQVLYVMCHVPQSVFCYLLSVLVQFCTDLIIALELLFVTSTIATCFYLCDILFAKCQPQENCENTTPDLLGHEV